MSVAEGVKLIRAGRQVKQTSDTSWEIISTDGKRKHHIVADLGRMELVCDCEAGKAGARCWAMQKVIDRLAMRFGGTVAHGPDVETPEGDPLLDSKGKYRAMPWWQAIRESQKEKAS